MSDCAGSRFNEKDDFQVVLSKGNPGESSGQKHYRWMGHWIKASSSEPQDGKSNSPLEDANNSTCIKDSLKSPSELMKSRMAERLMLGRNHERTYVEHAPQLNSSMFGVTHDACREAEQKKIEQRDGYFPSSMMQMERDDNLYAKTIVSEAFSISRLSELSLDFQKLVNSDNNLNSQWSQFPMFTIHQKIDSILNPRRRSATATVSKYLFVPQQTLKLNMDPSNLIAFSSHEYELLSHRITEGIMEQCKPPEGIIPLEDPTCLCSDPAGKKFKGHLPITVSRSRSKLGKDLLLNTQRIESAADATDSYMFSDPTADVLTVNSEGDAMTHDRQPVHKFSNSSKQKGPCLFEMLAVPSKSQSAYLTDSVCLEKSSSAGICMCRTNIGSLLCGAQNQFSAKTETLHRSKSSAGITSSLVRKESGCTDKRKSEQLATLSMKESSGYNKEDRFRDGNMNQDVSFKATVSGKQEFCTPGTEIMDLDPLPFQLSRMRNQIPKGAIQSPARTDPSDRWLKRLRLDVTDPQVPSSKRSKVLDEGIKIREIPHVTAKSVHCWVGRWCQGGGITAPVSHEDPDQRKRAPKIELGSGELHGQFPRIAAMAMMGRALSKFRPFAHQRKGPCVMWNTEGA